MIYYWFWHKKKYQQHNKLFRFCHHFCNNRSTIQWIGTSNSILFSKTPKLGQPLRARKLSRLSQKIAEFCKNHFWTRKSNRQGCNSLEHGFVALDSSLSARVSSYTLNFCLRVLFYFLFADRWTCSNEIPDFLSRVKDSPREGCLLTQNAFPLASEFPLNWAVFSAKKALKLVLGAT